MTMSDNKVLIEGINFMASAAWYTNTTLGKGRLRERQQTVVTRQPTYQSFICEMKAHWIDLLGDLDQEEPLSG